MEDKDWIAFQELLEKIITVKSGETWRERKTLLEEKAEEFGFQTNLEEIMSWEPFF